MGVLYPLLQKVGATRTATFYAYVTQCALETSYWTGFNHFVVWGSVVFYFVFIFTFYSELFGYSYMGTATTLMATSTFWLSVVLSVVLLLFPVVLCKLYVRETAPTLADRVRRPVSVSGALVRGESPHPVVPTYLIRN